MGERSGSGPLGLLSKLDAGRVEVLLSHPEVGMARPPHHRKPGVAASASFVVAEWRPSWNGRT